MHMSNISCDIQKQLAQVYPALIVNKQRFIPSGMIVITVNFHSNQTEAFLIVTTQPLLFEGSWNIGHFLTEKLKQAKSVWCLI